MSVITIIFATSSGTTRQVAEEMARLLGTRTRLIDLATFSWGDDCSVLVNDLVIAGGPSYGRGDWHHLWSSRFDEVAPILVASGRVALFGLGDTRFHGDTFCGGLDRLHCAVAALGVDPVGLTAPGRHVYRSTPSLRNGSFPGLVIDHRLDRRALPSIVGEWLESLPVGRRRIVRPYAPSTPDQKEVTDVASQHHHRSIAALSNV